MELLPNDVRQHRFSMRMRGYHPDEVDEFLEHVAGALEAALTHKQKAEEALKQLEEQLGRHRDQEDALKKAVLTVEQTMAQARESSLQDAESMRRSAEQRAREIVKEAELDRRKLEQDVRFLKESRQQMIEQLRAFCRAQLQTLENLERPIRAREAALDALLPKRPAAKPKAVSAESDSRSGSAASEARPWTPARVAKDPKEAAPPEPVPTQAGEREPEPEAVAAYPPPVVPDAVPKEDA